MLVLHPRGSKTKKLRIGKAVDTHDLDQSTFSKSTKNVTYHTQTRSARCALAADGQASIHRCTREAREQKTLPPD